MSNQVLSCVECQNEYPVNKVRYFCNCGGLLEVKQDIEYLKSLSTDLFDNRLMSFEDCDLSGVWRFREALLNIPTDSIKTLKEGRTSLYKSKIVSDFASHKNLYIKHEVRIRQDPLKKEV